MSLDVVGGLPDSGEVFVPDDGAEAPGYDLAVTSLELRREHAPHNVMADPGEIEHFYDRCSDLMRGLLDALAAAPETPRRFGEVEDSIGWPRRRIASILGGVS